MPRHAVVVVAAYLIRRWLSHFSAEVVAALLKRTILVRQWLLLGSDSGFKFFDESDQKLTPLTGTEGRKCSYVQYHQYPWRKLISSTIRARSSTGSYLKLLRYQMDVFSKRLFSTEIVW
ncbi:hypothetical protein LWI29_032868 [Acer saccharum]|uniref:Uncharacterized protein n=1 Tax=Acer saccharum TaxID=4024 RepID=A0AA39TG04_ACESA|nr:hypothetical protein LWI29_017087 [Acer saccharum]KAK0605987.1 hypothetical protein LWI29_032868 [Acer saccharum]